MSQQHDSSTEARVAAVEVANRRENEAVVPAPEAGWDLGLVERNCECGNAACRATLMLTVAEYEAIREDPRRFAVVHEHVVHAAEHVVERRPRYTIVQKVREAGRIAEAHDPRSS
jgi:hypothetical protein